MAASSAYYSNEEAIIQRETSVDVSNLTITPSQDLEKVYEIERCVKYIKENKCKTVALQFPDSLLIDASNIAQEIEKNCDAKIYILADTSYGHRDIDEVNAKHVTSDLLIHYGETSLTPSATIPTLFVFGRHKSVIDVDKVCASFCETFPNKGNTRVVFLHHVTCDYIADTISNRLLPDYPYMSVAELNIPKDPGGASGQNEDGEDDGNVLKDLCSNSCPGCPCRLKNEEKPKTKLNGTAQNDKNIDKDSSNLTQNDSEIIPNAMNSENVPKSHENTVHNKDSAAEFVTSKPNGSNSAIDDETKMEVDDTHEPDCKDYVTGFYTIPMETDKQLLDYNIFYLGPKTSESLKNLMLSHPTCDVYVFDPEFSVCEKIQSNTCRQLMKRFYLVEKAKDAKIVGILAGTMGTAGYLECMNYMKKIGKLAKKKIYTFIMGKLTPEKLANFMEIDIFVVVANAEHSIIDATDFYRPVITPYEFEVACNPNREWTENYITDFRSILPGGEDFVELPESYPEETSMSLITGSMRANMDIENCIEPNTKGAVALRNDKTDVGIFGSNSSTQRLSERSWKGLEQKIGETSVTKATVGRSGLPVSYNEMTDF